MYLCPDIQVMDMGLSIDGHIKDSQSFRILLPEPRFYEVQFYAVSARTGRKMETQFMTTET